MGVSILGEGGKCQLCGFEGPLQKHHLVPQHVCRNRYKEVKDDPSNHAYVCEMCHGTIHAYYQDSELRDRLSTIELLRKDERFASYLKWRSRHMDYSSSSTKMSRSKKGKT